MKKTPNFLFMALLLFVIAFISCDDNDKENFFEPEISVLSHNNNIDGPYLFYSNQKVESVSINVKNKLVREDVSGKSEINVELPHPYKSFKVKLKEEHKTQKAVYPASEKIFAVSDIEGNISALINLLKFNDVIDENYNWIFGNGHLVLNGDFVDRGNFVTQVLWLIYKLEAEAEAAGGKVHFIIGNHEDMLLRGNWKYTQQKYKSLTKSLGIKYKDLYGKNTELGKWLRTKNLITKIGDCIFVHAGLSKELLDKKLSITELNDIAIPYIGVDKKIRNKNKIVNFLYGSMGLLWYRGMVKNYKKYKKITSKNLDRLLQYYKAKKVIIGHTVVDEISYDFKGKIIRTDVHHHKNAQALLIMDKEIFYRVNDKGEKEKL